MKMLKKTLISFLAIALVLLPLSPFITTSSSPDDEPEIDDDYFFVEIVKGDCDELSQLL